MLFLILVLFYLVLCLLFCRRFYALKLIKEFGFDRYTRNDTNSTYGTCNQIQEDLLVAKQCNFHLSVNNDNKRLELIYWLLKLHKKPTNALFIIPAPVFSNKSLSNSLTSVLKLFFKTKTITTSKAVSFLALIPFGLFLTINQPSIPSTILTNAAKLY